MSIRINSMRQKVWRLAGWLAIQGMGWVASLPLARGKRVGRHYGALRFRAGWRRRVGAIALFVLIAGSVVLPFVDIEPTRAATLELLPNTDVSTGWVPSTGTTHYTLVDEPSTAPVTTDYISTGLSGSGGEVEEFGLTTATNVNVVSNVTIYIYAYSASNANGGNLDTVGINLRIGGSLQTAATVTPAYSATGAHAWYSASFNGSWNQSQIDGAQAYLIRNRVGGGSPSNQDDDIRIATVYAGITYTQSSLFDQSSYRWFDNEDSLNNGEIITYAKSWGGTGSDYARALTLDSSGNIYVAGSTASTGLTAGSADQTLVKYNSAGIEQWSKTWGGTSSDYAYALTLDSSGNIYVAGSTASTGLTAGLTDQTLLRYDNNGNIASCAECVDRAVTEVDRAVTEVDRAVTEVDRAGVATITTVCDIPKIDVADTLAALNTAATAPSEGTPFRLRLNLHVSTAAAEPALANFKLQMAPRGVDNVCDAGFSGETYADVSATSGVIRYYNNPNASDGMGLTANANDPTHGSDEIVRQAYEESNNFAVANAIPVGQDGMWDFALVDYDAPAATTYCFRAVSGAGSALSGYTVIPQLTTASATLSQESYRVYENESASLPTFAKTLGGTGSDSGYSVVPTGDGGYATTGYTASYGAGGADVLLSKYDAKGDLDWYRTWGGAGTDQGQTLAYTKDGGYVITGNTSSFNGTGSDMLIIKYNATGTLEWSRTWGETVNNEYGYKVIQTSDGGYAVSGRSQSYSAGGYDVFLAKYTSNGTLEWSRMWGGAGDDSSYAVIQTTDGGYMLTGQTKSYQETTNGEAFIAKYTANGTLEWSRTWGGAGIDYGYSVIQTDDGGYIAAGDSSSYGAGGLDSFVAKYTSDGTLSWSRTWGGSGSDYGRMVLATSDGGFVTAGVTASYGAGGTDMYYAKYTSDGTLSWSRTWGGAGNEYLRSLAITGDGGYVGTGDTASYGVGGIEMFLAKYDSSGTMVGCSSAICKSPSVTPGSPTPNTTAPNAGTSSPTATTGSPTATLNSPTPTTTVVVDTPSTFIKTMDAVGLDTVFATIPTADGGYVATGTAYGLGAGGNDLFIAKYKTDGALAWMRTWGGAGEETGQGIVAASDGGFVVTGYTNSYGEGGYDTVLLKYAADGTLSWFRLWGGASADVAYSLAAVNDGGFVIVGRTQSFGDVNNDAFMVKYDSAGTLLWSRTWGGSGVEYGSSVSPTSDGGFVVAGDTASSGAGSADMLLMKYASDGTLSWSRTWGGGASDYGKSVVQTSDGGYAVVGYTNSYGAGDSDAVLAKYASDGTLSWSRTWGGTGADAGYLVAQATDGGLALTGYTASYGAGNNDALFLKYTSDGTLSWSRTWGGTGLDLSNFIAQTSDGGYIAGGQTKSFGDTTNGDMFLARLDGYGDVKGCTSSNCMSPVGRVSSPAPSVVAPSTATATPAPTETTTTAGTSSPTPTFTARVAVAPVTQFQNGATVAATNTRAELLSTDMIFRLRIGLKNSGKTYATTGTFKLQSGASTIGTCDPATISYVDVSGVSSPIAFYDNGRMVNGDKAHLDDTDPLVANTRETMQTYVEANTFGNPRQLAVNDLGVWDFALKADGMKIGRTYCFRIVESGASLNGGYSQYAELYIPPAMDNVMRHGSFFNSRGVQQPYAWGRES